jgi:hypothetical protein
VKRFWDVIKPDFRAISQNLWASAIIGLIISIWSWVSPAKWLTAFYSWIQGASVSGILKETVGIIIPALGFGVVVFLIVFPVFRLARFGFVALKSRSIQESQNEMPEELPTPKIVREFARNLDSLTAGKNISGLGLRFLNIMKASPPFLGMEYMEFSLPTEQKLTEYFRALDFTEKYKEYVHGGDLYQIKPEDNNEFEKIAEKIYGNSEFSNRIKEETPGVYRLAVGMHIRLPYLDTRKSPDDPQKFLNWQFTIANNFDGIGPTFREVAQRYGLLADEAFPLLKTVYDAAQDTLKAEGIIKDEEQEPKEKG